MFDTCCGINNKKERNETVQANTTRAHLRKVSLLFRYHKCVWLKTAFRVTTRNRGAYVPGANVDADLSVDDYGNVIERDYDSQFYRPNKVSDEWQPTEDELATTVEPDYEYVAETEPTEVKEVNYAWFQWNIVKTS